MKMTTLFTKKIKILDILSIKKIIAILSIYYADFAFLRDIHDIPLGRPQLKSIVPSPSEHFHGQSECSADIEFINET